MPPPPRSHLDGLVKLNLAGGSVVHRTRLRLDAIPQSLRSLRLERMCFWGGAPPTEFLRSRESPPLPDCADCAAGPAAHCAAGPAAHLPAVTSLDTLECEDSYFFWDPTYPPSFPASLQLTSLSLSNCLCDFPALPSTLKTLSIRFPHGIRSPESLTSCIAQLRGLTALDLSLPGVYGSLHALAPLSTLLSLSLCHCSHNDTQGFLSTFASAPTLRVLCVRFLYHEDIKSFDFLAPYTSLTRLSFQDVSFSSELSRGPNRLPRGLSRLTSLRSLCLSDLYPLSLPPTNLPLSLTHICLTRTDVAGSTRALLKARFPHALLQSDCSDCVPV